MGITVSHECESCQIRKTYSRKYIEDNIVQQGDERRIPCKVCGELFSSEITERMIDKYADKKTVSEICRDPRRKS